MCGWNVALRAHIASDNMKLAKLFSRAYADREMKGRGTLQQARVSLVEIFGEKPAVHC